MKDKDKRRSQLPGFDRVELVGGPYDGLIFDGEDAGKFEFKDGVCYELQGSYGFYSPRDVRGYTMFMSFSMENRSY